MTPLELIERKKAGLAIPGEALHGWIQGVARGEIPDYQISAFLMAVYFRGMNATETAAYTRAIKESGRELDLSSLGAMTVDKHSTGGVGDKTSLVLAPAVAACGVPVPMLSGRGLGHTGGTLDKLESIPGFRTTLSVEEFLVVVRRAGFAIVGQSEDLAPADRVLYALRDVTGTIDSIPLIVGSIVGKKLAAGPQALVYDVKVGAGAFMRERADARRLAASLVEATEANGRRAVALLTAMESPLGQAIGNALEVIEAIETLRGGGPADLRELVVALGGEMLALAGRAPDAEAGAEEIEQVLDNGAALAAFETFLHAQGGNPDVVKDVDLLPRAPRIVTLFAEEAGRLRSIDARSLGQLSVELGAGRRRVDEEVDPGVGLRLMAKPGAQLSIGDELVEIHARSDAEARAVEQEVRQAFVLGDDSNPLPLILERVCAA